MDGGDDAAMNNTITVAELIIVWAALLLYTAIFNRRQKYNLPEWILSCVDYTCAFASVCLFIAIK